MRTMVDPEGAMVTSTLTLPRVAPSSGGRGGPPVVRAALRLSEAGNAGGRRCAITASGGTANDQRRIGSVLSMQPKRALDAAGGSLPAPDLGHRRRELLRERQQTTEMLTRLANVTGARPMPWLSPVPVNTAMLGLPNHVRACVFDVEGVLTNGGVLHAWAWGEVFDDLLLHLSGQTGWQFIPFDRIGDYRAFFDGRARLEGIHLFLASRGIRLPEGRFDDPAEAHTACGLAKRKGQMLARGLRVRGVDSAPRSRSLPRSGRTRESHACRRVVEHEHAAGARARRARDADRGASRRRCDPRRRVALASGAGPAAGRLSPPRRPPAKRLSLSLTARPASPPASAAGLAVIAVGDGAYAELLRGFGAERVVPSLDALLDGRIADRGGLPEGRRLVLYCAERPTAPSIDR